MEKDGSGLKVAEHLLEGHHGIVPCQKVPGSLAWVLFFANK